VKIALTQPNFIPWLGYFDLLDTVDCWISYDNTQVVKQSSIVRNKILSASNNLSWLTASLKKHSLKDQINKVELADITWHISNSNKIRNYYRKAKFFNDYIDEIVDILKPRETLLSLYNKRIIDALSSLIGIKYDSIEASSLVANISGDREDKILHIIEKLQPAEYYNFKKGVEMGFYSKKAFNKKGIALYKQDYIHPEYKQHHNIAFIPYLSIIDLIFNEGANSLEIIREGRNWIQITS
jgi:hypothetical protein